MNWSPICLLAVLLLLFGAHACTHAPRENALRFNILDDEIRNDFIRRGPVAAHVALKSTNAPRLVVAFPAGNSGVGVWFQSQNEVVRWGEVRNLEPVSLAARDGAVRHGVRFETEIDASHLEIRKVILGSVRTLREYDHSGAVPFEVEAPPRIEPGRVIWERQRIDGGPGYYLSIETPDGSVTGERGGPLIRAAAPGTRIKLRVTALSGDRPMTGVDVENLLADSVQSDERLRDVLAFLSYEEKFLAGSWQYNTYFGRDTLMSIALLGSALKPAAIEGGLRSVLDRLNSAGEVAHEEDIGEFALLTRLTRGEPLSDAPIFDYKMVDDDFMLAPVLAGYILDTEEGRERAAAFFANLSQNGETYGALMLRNLYFVIESTKPFADDPHFSRMIRVKTDDPPVGNWRDSKEGLGGGVFPYDVNVALAPAALTAAYRLGESGLLDEYSNERRDWAAIRRAAEIWKERAPGYFAVAQGKDKSFPALALDRLGSPIPVMHSDIGYLLLFGDPSPSEIERAIELPLQPHPAGLLTPVGMLVANAASAPSETAMLFDKARYHGAVIWPWQQAMMAAGIRRQMRRPEIEGELKHRLRGALKALDESSKAIAARKSSELLSWSIVDGKYQIVRFGEDADDETESNAAQLWSTVFLGRGKAASN